MSDITVLCVDDEKYIVDCIRDYISREYSCRSFHDPDEALAYLQEKHADILIVDYRMPGINGLDLLRQARELNAYTLGFLLTAYADKDLLKDVLNQGLVDKVLEKPLDLPTLKNIIDTAAEKIRENLEQKDKQKDIYRLLALDEEGDFRFIGKDSDLKELWRQTEMAAPTDENILITGETGTGKDVLARQIHGLSSRKDQPFIKINCGAIPATLIESELFGHERGAFSGAERRKFGKIELAHEGTLFLDEIGELPPELQSRLLHVVEDKSLERVGGTTPVPVDFRLISATNKNLSDLKGDEFRRDLFYRIATVHLHLPDLKERRNDLPLHIITLLNKNTKLFGKPRMEINTAVMDLLCRYSWPGNIRELDNVLKRVILMKQNGGRTLTVQDFRHLCIGTHESAGSGEQDSTFSAAVDRISESLLKGENSIQAVQHSVLKKLIDLCGGKIMEASRKTGIPKDRFYRMREKK